MRRLATALLAVTMTWAPAAGAEKTKLLPGHDYTPEGWTKQPSFLSPGGQLARNEHAVIVYLDGDMFTPPVMVGYRYGILYWWDMGVEVGGTNGTFQALVHFKMENLKSFETEFFYWGNRIKTGFKQHEYKLDDDFLFDDRSWILTFENAFGFRLGMKRDKVIYINTVFYADFDLHDPRRQHDLYIAPANIGFETMIGKYGNFFVEVGMTYSINGMQTYKGTLFANQWFPTFRIGVAGRTGDRTAIYYAADSIKKKHGVE